MTHPWEKSYPKGLEWDQEIISQPIYNLLDQTAETFPDNTAFNFLGSKMTWSEINTLSKKMARGLQRLGVRKGTKVGIMLPNCPYFIIAFYAIARTGATAVNFNPLYSEREISYQIEDSATDIMITLDLGLMYYKLEKMLHSTRLNQIVICPFTDCLPFPKNMLFKLFKGKERARIPNNDRHLFYDVLIDNSGKLDPVEINPDEDVALFQYTGGTTGVPKAAQLTHTNISANVEQVAAWLPGARPGVDKMLGVLPFFHVFAMTVVMNLSVKSGFEIIATPRFDLEDTLKIIDKEKPQLFPAVPAIYSAINNHKKRTQYDLTSLRTCVSGGAPLPVEVKKTFEKKTGCVVV
ncbi:MAG: AMP-binding protein, partial [Bdellovibrionales bacterium]